jgi:hypothetical protein
MIAQHGFGAALAQVRDFGAAVGQRAGEEVLLPWL